MKRRSFIQHSSIAGIGLAGFVSVSSCSVFKRNYPYQSLMHPGYGPLQPDPDGIIDLPQGFTYKVISRSGDIMDDGFLVPGMLDGMGAFKSSNDNIIVIRNHELSPGHIEIGAFSEDSASINNIPREKYYDFGRGHAQCMGGTTTFIYNPKTMEVEEEYLSLIGTMRNCSGGVTPWNTWLSCEEDVSVPNEGFEKYHGYIFEIPATGTPGLIDPVPLKAMGRFNHEAVSVHPETGIIYQTEDRDESLFYRFVPNQYGDLSKGGKLQALCLKAHPQFETRNWESNKMKIGEKYEVEWVDLEDVDRMVDDLRYRGYAKGAAIFARGEGCYYSKGLTYFTCTSGGKKKLGQMFKYTPSSLEGNHNENDVPATLELFLEPNNERLMRNCDNFTASAHGDLIVCEDRIDSRLIGITMEGEIYEFAHIVGHRSELTGVTFSPDGNTMFVNIQSPGLTLAITGPWSLRKA